jgi:hypothetical protein
LSLGGVGLLAGVSWPEGSQIHVRIDEYQFEFDGVICFRVESEQEFRYGVKCHLMSFRELYKLRQILRERYIGPLAVA